MGYGHDAARSLEKACFAYLVECVLGVEAGA